MADEAPVSAMQAVKPSTSTVVGALGGGALSTILLWIAGEYFHINPPPEVAAAFAVLVAALCGMPFSGGTSEKSL